MNNDPKPLCKKIIDVHCHYLAFSKQYGGHVHQKFAESYLTRFYLNAIGILSIKEALCRRLPAFEIIDERYRTLLTDRIEASPLQYAVILAFDGIYDEHGYFDTKKTHQSVSNDAVIELCKTSQKMLVGASINPLRRDWKDELDKCLESGAVLVKWLPNVMDFDPADPKLQPFYRAVCDAKIPILMHVGFEYSVPNADIRFSGVDRLEKVLEFGVTVIASHCGGGRPIIDDRKMFTEIRDIVWKYPNIYLDVSAMASFHRKSRFLNALHNPIVSSRLVFGTDYPIPVQPWAFQKEIAGEKLPENYFERDLFIKKATGLPDLALSRGYEPLKDRLPQILKQTNE